jgi:hypothetical protein
MDRFKLARLAVPCTLVLALGVLAACDDASVATGPQGSAVLSIAPANGQVDMELVEICKFGTAASFQVSINGGAPTIVNLADGECRNVHLHGGAVQDIVTVTENVPAGFQLDKIEKTTLQGSTVTTVDITGTNTVSGGVDGDSGALFKFFNSPIPPPPGGEGCTPGYWKQAQHFDSWPSAYTPGQLFSSVFEDAFPGKTLLQVLQQGGGGLNALGRHTVAALLNAASSGVSYDLSESDVINAFNAVFPGGDYEGQKNIFAGFNEQGCPLN